MFVVSLSVLLAFSLPCGPSLSPHFSPLLVPGWVWVPVQEIAMAESILLTAGAPGINLAYTSLISNLCGRPASAWPPSLRHPCVSLRYCNFCRTMDITDSILNYFLAYTQMSEIHMFSFFFYYFIFWVCNMFPLYWKRD